MIELERHIEILLLTNDCVIIPAFGGFMAHYTTARFDERDFSFLPPTRTIGFNPLLKINDSLLAQSYVEAYDISYPEALCRIEQETEEMKQILEREGKYELKDLGTLFINDEGHYTFEPCEAGLLTPALYGLSCFEFKRLDAVETFETEQEVNVVAPQPKAQLLDFNTTANGEEKEEEAYTIRRSVVRNIAIACIAILVFLLLPSSLGNGDIATMTGNKIDTDFLTYIMPKDVTIGNATTHITKDMTKKAVETVQQKQTADNNKIKADIIPAVAPKNYYCIVLASRVTRKNAKLFVRELHRKGYTEADVLTQNNRTKVIYGEYASEREARNIVNKLNNKAEFADCWVMHIK